MILCVPYLSRTALIQLQFFFFFYRNSMHFHTISITKFSKR
jgi:hypothetical protein